ncbi:hypothetical protein [Glutamicibacter endophyticus]|uniref:hypothetical protein n=1 Tax=Glutamicibacter endophyticus TaxID=1522174 RepID=UPI003AF15E66
MSGLTTRVIAMLSALLAFAHVVMAIAGHHGAYWSVALVAMAGLCGKCALETWRGGALGGLMLMSGLMVIVHALLILGLPWVHQHGAGHSGHATASASMAWMAVAEFAVMLLCAMHLRRTRTQVRAPRATLRRLNSVA